MGVAGAVARTSNGVVGILLFPTGREYCYFTHCMHRCVLESPSTLDDQRWLIYWASALATVETIVLHVACATDLKGAGYIYENFARKYVKIAVLQNSNYPEGQKKVLQMMSLDARKSMEKYIEKNGPDAFERVVKAVEREAKKQ